MFIPSPQQQRFFDWVATGSGHAILEAVAGAGKTTTLIQALHRMQGSVWLGVFNKKLADEIVGRLSSEDDPFGTSHQVHASTFHSAGFTRLRRTGKVRVDNDKCKTIAKALIEEREGIDQLQNRRLRVATSLALRLVSLGKNRLLTPGSPDTDWLDIIEHHNMQLPDGVTPDLLIDFAWRILTRSQEWRSVIDFDDMIYRPVVERIGGRQYDWVLIDEAQDTNPARRELAAMLLKPSGRFIAVGDPRQAIYGFTGADNDALDQLRSKYQAVTLPLSITFRCPRQVVDHARSFGATLEVAPDAREGSVTSMTEEDMIEYLRDTTEAERANSALVCRVTKHLVRLCYGFIRQGIPARVEGRSIGEGLLKLATRWKVSDLSDLSERVEDYRARELAKAQEQENDALAERIADQTDTLQLLIDLTTSRGGHHLSDLRSLIEEMFSDGVTDQKMLTLCTVHRAKGLEWSNVYLLGRAQLMPSPWAEREWAVDQEWNLVYVAITRALDRLIEVTLDKP